MENKTIASEIITEQENNLKEIMFKLDEVNNSIEKIEFILLELLELVDETPKNMNEVYAFSNNQDRMNMFACIALDFLVNTQKEVKEILQEKRDEENMEGHIKIHRKLLNWEWYSDINTSRLFIHMLLVANWKEQRFRGVMIPRGAFASSVPKLAEETGLSIQEIKTALNHLKSTGEVTCKVTGKYTVFIVNNYHFYQQDNRQTNLQSTDNQPTTNLQSTCLKEEEGKK